MTADGRKEALVTGASGFLGTEITRALLTEGWRVRAAVRTPGRTVANGARAVQIDLSDRASLAAALAGVDAVVHAAGRAHVLRADDARDLAAFRQVNVEGTRALLHCALEAGVSSFVFLSSIAVIGDDAGEPITEDARPAPRTAYGRSKLEAEQLIRDVASGRGFNAPILRPAMAYGPGMKGNPLRLFRLVDRGVPLPFAAVKNQRSVLYSGNLAAAVIAALSARSGCETFLVADPEPVSTPQLIRLIAAGLGKPARLVAVPPAWLRALGRAGDVLRLGPLRSDTIEKLIGSARLEATRLADRTGFQPSWTTSDAIRLTARWFYGSTAHEPAAAR